MNQLSLVTTALEDTWPEGGGILFLGKWCTLYGRKEKWQPLNHRILPYHWDDRNKLLQDYFYLENIYERNLATLSVSLNSIHGERHDTEFWRIILGPWLKYFITILFDRYTSLKHAAERYAIGSTRIRQGDVAEWVPANFREFHSFFASDEFNHHLYAQLIRELHLAETIEIVVDKSDPKALSVRRDTGRSTGFEGDARRRKFPRLFDRISFFSSGFSRNDSAKLLLSMGQWPHESSGFSTDNTRFVNTEQRKQISVVPAGNEFEEILSQWISRLLPYSYLENYPGLVQETSGEREFPKLIFTVSGTLYNDDDGFKIWAAGAKEQGTKLVLGQHGGNFGTAAFCDSEKHQVAIADQYFSWGWNSEKENNVIPMPSAKLTYAAKKIRVSKGGDIAWLLNEGRRYAYRLAAFPISSQWEEYFNDQVKFLEACSGSVRDWLMLRPHPKASHGWDAVGRLKDVWNGLRVIPEGTSIYDQLNSSCLCICTFNTTAHLETLAANFPTLLFWNPAHWEIRPEALAAHEMLRQAGILWDKPEDAAHMVDKISSDVNAWWESVAVQEARQRFVQSYAKTSSRLVKDFRSQFKTILHGN